MLLTSPKFLESLFTSVSAVKLIGLAIMDIILDQVYSPNLQMLFLLEVSLKVYLDFFVTALQYGCVTGKGHD
jgi:hypothetical protein